MQSSRLYVGGIGQNVPTPQVEEIFNKHGKILDIRRNKSFSFVQFADDASAQNAILSENGKTYFGKTIEVQLARSSYQGGNKFDSRNQEGGEDDTNKERFEMLNYGRGGGRGGSRGGGRGGGPDRFDSPRDSPIGGMGGRGRGFPGGPFGFPPDDRGRDDIGGGRPPVFDGGRVGGPPPWSDHRPSEAPPTQPPSALNIPHNNRSNDIEIIVIDRSITDYGEAIEGKLKSLAFTVDLLFPNEEVPLPRVLANIASRGTLYAVLITPIHKQYRSLTLNILHGSPQEHRNMLVEDAVMLISRNYEMYVMKCGDKKNSDLPPEDIRALLQLTLQAPNRLSLPQVDKLLTYFNHEKSRIESESIKSAECGNMPQGIGTPVKGPSAQETELQNRILNIMNRGSGGGPPVGGSPGVPNIMMPSPQPMGGGGGGMPPPLMPTPQKAPLLSDPSVQKALNNLIQGFTPPAMGMPR